MPIRFSRSLFSKILFGRPIPTEEAAHQTISKKVGLAVFASDALSSVAYATQEIFVVLIVAGAAALSMSIPIAVAIMILLTVLSISYWQTVHAYPSGGGAYIVAKDNLGITAAQVAGAALLMDYILTVAVSVSSGVDQIVSAVPAMNHQQVPIALAIIAIMTWLNLRGVKESGRILAVPTYFFIGTIFTTLAVGAYRYFTGSLTPVEGVENIHETTETLSLFLILRAFSSGCTALTGVEAISNGIPAFKEPKSDNAAKTLIAMSVILAGLFIGITLLAVHVQAVPSEHETIISQLARAIWGRGIMYTVVIASTTTILIMAANTSFADFPRLSALQAGDGFLPRQLTYRSGRLVFGGGIVLLMAAAALLIVIFRAHTTSLIPLYAIGVFLSFTLSQSGMVVHWWKEAKLKRGMSWLPKLIINGIGAIMTFIVMIVFAVTKFATGAWVTLILIPSLCWMFFKIHSHYGRVAKALGFAAELPKPSAHPMRTVVLLDYVHRGTLRMIDFTKSLGHPWVAVHVNYDDEKAKKVRDKWIAEIGDPDHLILITSPYRLLVEPVRDFILAERDKLPPDGFVHVITGQVVIEDPFTRMLHSKNARGLLDELQFHDRIIVTAVPFQL